MAAIELGVRLSAISRGQQTQHSPDAEMNQLTRCNDCHVHDSAQLRHTQDKTPRDRWNQTRFTLVGVGQITGVVNQLCRTTYWTFHLTNLSDRLPEKHIQ